MFKILIKNPNYKDTEGLLRKVVDKLTSDNEIVESEIDKLKKRLAKLEEE